MGGANQIWRKTEIHRMVRKLVEKKIEGGLMVDGLALFGSGASTKRLVFVNDGGDVAFGHSTAFGAVAVISEGRGEAFEEGMVGDEFARGVLVREGFLFGRLQGGNIYAVGAEDIGEN